MDSSETPITVSEVPPSKASSSISRTTRTQDQVSSSGELGSSSLITRNSSISSIRSNRSFIENWILKTNTSQRSLESSVESQGDGPPLPPWASPHPIKPQKAEHSKILNEKLLFDIEEDKDDDKSPLSNSPLLVDEYSIMNNLIEEEEKATTYTTASTSFSPGKNEEDEEWLYQPHVAPVFEEEQDDDNFSHDTAPFNSDYESSHPIASYNQSFDDTHPISSLSFDSNDAVDALVEIESVSTHFNDASDDLPEIPSHDTDTQPNSPPLDSQNALPELFYSRPVSFHSAHDDKASVEATQDSFDELDELTAEELLEIEKIAAHTETILQQKRKASIHTEPLEEKQGNTQQRRPRLGLSKKAK
ncbi:uncharacterized protein B0P05DRAFT_522617 [Gilbertella persicaria]|uniref:uncharacterized protein n=1 Tax=Gilbertella persicaria TaxID=101096 RepID=UPI0022208D1E|nr:uncharacterized protein B0P05DRAFT_522617 [Gilbertella persicaria]KAI8097924.1 hypothetical protein B0P05DRAFT_522617 [Gilbertella persicaria]